MMNNDYDLWILKRCVGFFFILVYLSYKDISFIKHIPCQIVRVLTGKKYSYTNRIVLYSLYEHNNMYFFNNNNRRYNIHHIDNNNIDNTG